jgi:hypothetical protein
MSKKITLPSGATVTIKDASELKVRDRNRIMVAGDGESPAAKGIALGNAMLAAVIEDWSYDLLIPSVKLETIGDLSIPDYVALTKLSDEFVKAIFPELNDTDKNRLDPDSPLENSND